MEEVCDLSRMDPIYLQILYNIYLYERQEKPQINHSLKFHPLDLTAGFGHVGEGVTFFSSICGEDEASDWSDWTLLVDRGSPDEPRRILQIIERLRTEKEAGRKVVLLSNLPFVGQVANTCLRIPLSVYESYQSQIDGQFARVEYMD